MTAPHDSRYVGPHRPIPTPEPGGPHLGRIAITPLRVTLGLALALSLLIVGYGLLVRDDTQIPILTAGAAISGVVFGLLAVAGAYAAYRQAADGRSGRALGYAVLGGVAALLAAGSIASAVILALVVSE